jgi:hypothetical protein
VVPLPLIVYRAGHATAKGAAPAERFGVGREWPAAAVVLS